MQPFEINESCIHQLLAASCGFEVFLIFRVFVKKVVKSSPEAGRPSVGVLRYVNSIGINSVGKLVTRAKGYFSHLRVYLGENLFRPRAIFFNNLIVIFHCFTFRIVLLFNTFFGFRREDFELKLYFSLSPKNY